MASHSSIAPAELAARLGGRQRPIVLDVRSAREFADGHVPGATNIPYSEIGVRVTDLPAGPDEELILYCGHGPRAWIAARSLRRRGYRRICYLRGHWASWRRAGFDVER